MYRYLLSITIVMAGLYFCPQTITGATDNSHQFKNIEERGNYSNSKRVFDQTRHGRVAFLGGSITEMDGYRPMVCSFLKKQFPQTEFTFIDAGISSTCSTTGAFRLERDILSKGPIDLLFLEFAVNDDQDAHHSIQKSIRGLEGIIRQIRHQNANVDIILICFVNEPIMDAFRSGTKTDSIKAHQETAQHYNIVLINLAKEITEQIDSGKLTWKEFGGVHPAPRGNRICVDMIEAFLLKKWDQTDSKTKYIPHPMPEQLDPNSYCKGNFLSCNQAQFTEPWKWDIPDWKSINGTCRARFIKEKLLSCDTPGVECSLSFKGTAIGAYILAGPDAGIMEYKIDNGSWCQKDFYHQYSAGLQYPRTVIFNDELSDGPHQIRFRLSADKNPRSTGTTARILQFTVNGQN